MNSFDNKTTIHPLGLLALLILGMIVLSAKREKALLPLIIISCFVSSAQRIVVAGLDFNFIRMMVIFGWTRILSKKEHVGFKLEFGDKLMIAWAVSKTILHTIQQGEFHATVYQLGNAFETLGIYFMTRVLVRSIEDVKTLVRMLLLLCIPLAVLFLVESKSGHNLFSVLGGVPKMSIVREGRVRAQGAFAHPILAGSFFASVVPMVLALVFKDKKLNLSPFVGFMSLMGIIYFCASSTPVVGVLFAIIGMSFFMFRYKMKTVQKLIVIGLIGLDLAMKAPLWHLLSRIDIAGGSTGYFRYLLIDKAIAHFKDWALVGVPSTGYWSDIGGENMSDIVNQYIFEGVEGGFLTMALFIAVMVVCFATVGRIIKSKKLSGNDELLIWSLGAALFTHSFMFLVVSYFGQIVMLWNMLLGIIISMGVVFKIPRVSPVTVNTRTLSSDDQVLAPIAKLQQQ